MVRIVGCVFGYIFFMEREVFWNENIYIVMNVIVYVIIVVIKFNFFGWILNSGIVGL